MAAPPCCMAHPVASLSAIASGVAHAVLTALGARERLVHRWVAVAVLAHAVRRGALAHHPAVPTAYWLVLWRRNSGEGGALEADQLQAQVNAERQAGFSTEARQAAQLPGGVHAQKGVACRRAHAAAAACALVRASGGVLRRLSLRGASAGKRRRRRRCPIPLGLAHTQRRTQLARPSVLEVPFVWVVRVDAREELKLCHLVLALGKALGQLRHAEVVVVVVEVEHHQLVEGEQDGRRQMVQPRPGHVQRFQPSGVREERPRQRGAQRVVAQLQHAQLRHAVEGGGRKAVHIARAYIQPCEAREGAEELGGQRIYIVVGQPEHPQELEPLEDARRQLLESVAHKVKLGEARKAREEALGDGAHAIGAQAQVCERRESTEDRVR
mmetsp:Transcript_1907/g.5477  ORF Transcript_1907/g.5477 Transcript_1907/m.5477 type:complete len:383 (-) Transcript_1907:956-2104(-)